MLTENTMIIWNHLILFENLWQRTKDILCSIVWSWELLIIGILLPLHRNHYRLFCGQDINKIQCNIHQTALAQQTKKQPVKFIFLDRKCHEIKHIPVLAQLYKLAFRKYNNTNSIVSVLWASSKKKKAEYFQMNRYSIGCMQFSWTYEVKHQ